MQVIREICDRVAVIEGGVILEEGSTLEVFTNPKKPTTKDFVGSVVSDNLPQEALEHLELHDDWIAGTSPLVNWSLPAKLQMNLLWLVSTRFDLDVSILFGGIDYIQNTSVGRSYRHFEWWPYESARRARLYQNITNWKRGDRLCQSK